jgi:hypothetical protein
MSRFYPSVLFLAVFLFGSSFSVFAQGTSQQSATKPTSPAATAATSNSGAISGDESSVDENPVTVKTSSDSTSKKPVDTDPLFGVPPLPKGKTSLVGGTVAKIDGVHNRLGVKVFDGGKWTVAFDERTHFYRDGAETTFEKVKKGDRVYVDTMLDGHQIFARNVHVITKNGPASASGQVTAFNNGVMIVDDDLSSRPVRFRVDGETQVKRDGGAATISEVQPGSLVTVRFAPGVANRGVAREVTILASPGQAVTFDGTVRNIDLRSKELAIENHIDSKTYEVAVDGDPGIPDNLMVGSEVTVAAVFDGRGYKAKSIAVK